MSNRATMTEAIGNGISQRLKLLNTQTPGYVLKFDPETQLAELQVSIERIDKNGKSSKWSPIIRCPVQFGGGNEFHIEHQIDIGDEGIIEFSQRCIDAWVDQGGVAPQSIIQFHDMNDAMFVPGLRSQPNKISDFKNDGVRIRNKSGSQEIWVKNDESISMKNSSGYINLLPDGRVDINGLIIDTSGNATTASGISLDEHGHQPGTYNVSGTPVTGEAGDPT